MSRTLAPLYPFTFRREGRMKAVVWMVRLVSASVLVFGIPAALAGQAPPCDVRTFSDMHRCAVARYQQADADHNRVYHELAARLDSLPRRKLKRAEDVWRRYREAQCDFQSSRSAGRREYQVVRLRCMAEVTEARTAMLRMQLTEG